MSTVDQVEYWAARWEAGQSQWHSSSPNASLVSHLDLLTGEDKQPVSIFVPLCGKSGCLLHLYNSGHTVVGAEAVESVVEQFFIENKLEVTKTEIPGVEGHLYATPDGRLKIFACDLFLLTPQLVGGLEAVWDRGSLVALGIETRPRYVALVRSLLAGRAFRYLLEGWEYDQSLVAGPPHSLSKDHVEKLFGDWTKIQVVEEAKEEGGKARLNMRRTFFMTSVLG